MSFETFRKRANSAKIAETVQKNLAAKTYDDGSWNIKPDKETGTAMATIRFLPSKDGDLPYELVYSHFFKGDDGRWCIIERCPRTYKDTCEICQMNGQLYNTGKESDKAIARLRKARKTYLFNILVVNEPAHPENNGKVFVYKCGPAVFQMVCDAMESQFGEEPKRPFDLDSGHNFTIRVRTDQTKNNLPQYDKSSFSNEATPVAKDDVELERIYNEMVDLKAFVMKGKISSEEIHKKAVAAYYKVLPTVESVDSHTTSFSSKSSEPMESVKAMDKLPWDDEEDVKGTIKPSEQSDPKEFFEQLINEDN